MFRKLMQIYSRFICATLAPVCLLCGYRCDLKQRICSYCAKNLPILSHHCRQCARILYARTELDLRCGACQKFPPPFDRTYALFPYQTPIIEMIVRLKFHAQLHFANAFAEVFMQKIRENWYQNEALPDLIVPVPLHPNRLRERGFNQALEIAKPIANTFGLPLEVEGVKRIKATKAQSGLLAQDRKQNITNAFIATRSFSGANLAVLDDVITTGQTISAFCSVLKAAGARRIDVWCCARRG